MGTIQTPANAGTVRGVNGVADALTEEETDWAVALVGAVIGVVLGGAVTLLLVPRSGHQTRQEIFRGIDGVKDRAEVTLDQIQEGASDLALRTRSGIAETRDNIFRSIEAGKEAYVQRKEELIQELES